MAPEENLAVRLTATIALKHSIDEWDFEPDAFLQYFETCLDLFTRLVHEVVEFDSKMKVLNCLAIIVERLENKVSTFFFTFKSMPKLSFTNSLEHDENR